MAILVEIRWDRRLRDRPQGDGWLGHQIAVAVAEEEFDFRKIWDRNVRFTVFVKVRHRYLA